MEKGMLLKALSRDDDRIAQVGRIARERAHAAGVPATTSTRAWIPRVASSDTIQTARVTYSPTATRTSSSIAS